MSELAITELRTEVANLKKRLDALEAPTHLPTLPGGGPAQAGEPLPTGANGIDWSEVEKNWRGLNIHHEKARDAYVKHVAVLNGPPDMADLKLLRDECSSRKLTTLNRDELAANFGLTPAKAAAIVWFLQKAQLAIWENGKIRFIE